MQGLFIHDAESIIKKLLVGWSWHACVYPSASTLSIVMPAIASSKDLILRLIAMKIMCFKKESMLKLLSRQIMLTEIHYNVKR